MSALRKAGTWSRIDWGKRCISEFRVSISSHESTLPASPLPGRSTVFRHVQRSSQNYLNSSGDLIVGDPKSRKARTPARLTSPLLEFCRDLGKNPTPRNGEKRRVAEADYLLRDPRFVHRASASSFCASPFKSDGPCQGCKLRFANNQFWIFCNRPLCRNPTCLTKTLRNDGLDGMAPGKEPCL